jgi:hypothetical protein
MDMLCIMAVAARRGYLEVDGKPCSIGQLAQIVGATKSSVSRWLAELEQNGVFSRDENGFIFNRRMVREASENGRNPKPRKGADRERGRDQGELPLASRARANGQAQQGNASQDSGIFNKTTSETPTGAPEGEKI